MKNFLLLIQLAFVLFSFNSFAVSIKPSLVDGELYNLEYKLVSSSKLCPTIENEVTCLGLGHKIKLKALLKSCIDQEHSFNYHTFIEGNTLIVEIDAQAIKHPMADQVRCAKAGEIVKTFTVSEHFFEKIKIINL